jgi:NAD+ kinase
MLHCTLARVSLAASQTIFRRIALIAKLRSPEIATSLRDLAGYLKKRGCEVHFEKDSAAEIGERGADYDTLGAAADLAVVIGGDGTMLAAARSLVRHRVPVVGVNLGRVGFMTDIGHLDMQAGIGAILEGKGTVEERTLLDAEVVRDGAAVLRTLALNEAVLGKGAEARLIEFELSLDGEYVYTLRADGVIVATPTGSTADNLAAGGPILMPQQRAMSLTPICAHSLTMRPLVVSHRSSIGLRLDGDSRGVVLTVDGQWARSMLPGDTVEITPAPRPLVVFDSHKHYFDILREKLHWGARAIR